MCLLTVPGGMLCVFTMYRQMALFCFVSSLGLTLASGLGCSDGHPLRSRVAVEPLAEMVKISAHQAIYDPVGDRLVVYGGRTSYSLVRGLFFYDLASGQWTRVEVPDPPGPRFLHTMVYDADDHRAVVFGGRLGTTSLNDVWTLSLDGDPAWSPIETPSPPPSPRYAHTAVYDARRDRMIVYGGLDADPGDLWALSLGPTPDWQRLQPAGEAPKPRTNAAAAYDPVRDRMILIGGTVHAYEEYIDDSWALDLSDGLRWEQIAPAGVLGPYGRFGHSVVYDPESDRILLYGGATVTPHDSLKRWTLNYRELWELPLASNQWRKIGSPGGPQAMFEHSAVFEPGRQEMLILGGRHWRTYGPWDEFNALWRFSTTTVTWELLR